MVNLMSTQDDDPHGYQPDAFSIANLACADLLITMGEDIDTWLPELRRTSTGRRRVVLDLSAEGDPHRLLPAVRLLLLWRLRWRSSSKHWMSSTGRTMRPPQGSSRSSLRRLTRGLPRRFAPGFSFAVAGANPYGCLEELPGVVLVAAGEGCNGETEQWDEELLERARKAGVQMLLFNERDDADKVQALAQELGVETLFWHALHMVPQEQREEGATLLSLLEQTVEALEQHALREEKGA